MQSILCHLCAFNVLQRFINKTLEKDFLIIYMTSEVYFRQQENLSHLKTFKPIRLTVTDVECILISHGLC